MNSNLGKLLGDKKTIFCIILISFRNAVHSDIEPLCIPCFSQVLSGRGDIIWQSFYLWIIPEDIGGNQLGFRFCEAFKRTINQRSDIDRLIDRFSHTNISGRIHTIRKSIASILSHIKSDDIGGQWRELYHGYILLLYDLINPVINIIFCDINGSRAKSIQPSFIVLYCFKHDSPNFRFFTPVLVKPL